MDIKRQRQNLQHCFTSKRKKFTELHDYYLLYVGDKRMIQHDLCSPINYLHFFNMKDISTTLHNKQNDTYCGTNEIL
jgi:hypothetical protein